ncbi:MAG TPA: mechanosensitive ion channel family protein [Sulfurovum sp.]
MKKIIFFLFILLTSSLFSSDLLNNFIDEQVNIERQLLDQNISLNERIKIKEEQANRYKEFLLQYAANKEEYLQQNDPYKNEISKLQLRLNSNKHKNNVNAVMRDELLIKSYQLRRGIREAFHEVMLLTESESKSFFKDKIDETLIKYFSKYTPLDKEKYISPDQDQSSPIVQSLNAAIQDLEYIESVANTFSAELVANSSYVYRAGRLSQSNFYSFLKKVNSSSFGGKINIYLSKYHLDLANVLFVISIIILIVITHLILRFIVDRTLKYYRFKEDDIEYIHTHITKLFKLITTLLIIHLIIVAYLGLDITSMNISKLFSIVYVILFTLVLYRITNTIAYLKMESIRSSKLLANEVINLTIKVINTLLILMAIIAILKIIGVNLTALLSGLGIAGAAVAFAAKDSIANVFGSISILLGDVFKQGDWIETKDINGTVVEIGLRASTIRTFDNALISIPNFELANSGVKNWSRRSIGRRIKMNIGVTYESDFNDIRNAIEDIRTMLKEHPGIANEATTFLHTHRQAKLVSMEDYKGIKRNTLVYLDEFADSSINILVYCFSRSVVWHEWLEVKEDVMFKIAEILKKNNLEFAYPTLKLHHADKEKTPDTNSSNE